MHLTSVEVHIRHLPRFPRCQLGTAKVEAAKAAKGGRLAPVGRLEEAQLDIQRVLRSNQLHHVANLDFVGHGFVFHELRARCGVFLQAARDAQGV